jgi:hypothetical protein
MPTKISLASDLISLMLKINRIRPDIPYQRKVICLIIYSRFGRNEIVPIKKLNEISPYSKTNVTNTIKYLRERGYIRYLYGVSGEKRPAGRVVDDRRRSFKRLPEFYDLIDELIAIIK